MGIYDRDYYRKEGPSYLDRLVPSGAVCKWLIIINLIVFFAQMASEWRLNWYLALSPERVYEGELWRLLSHAFLHGDFWHLFFNMFGLWMFGSELEEMYGSREFLLFYLGAALAGAAGYLVHGAFNITVFHAYALGASGAVTGLVLLFCLHFPGRTILLMMVFPMPVWFFLLFTVGQDVFGLFSTDHRIAVAAHLGGAAFGALYYQLGWRISGLWGQVKSWRRSRSRPRLKIYRPEEKKEAVSVGVRQASEVEHLEAKVDAVLEKVARSGQESLTEKEREVLLKASEIYKKRRT